MDYGSVQCSPGHVKIMLNNGPKLGQCRHVTAQTAEEIPLLYSNLIPFMLLRQMQETL
jgi:hypothetical protein